MDCQTTGIPERGPAMASVRGYISSAVGQSVQGLTAACGGENYRGRILGGRKRKIIVMFWCGTIK